MTAKQPTPQGITEPTLQAGSPCPRGCTVDAWQREPELLTANIDGELSCPTCWDYFGIVEPVPPHPEEKI